MEAAASWWRKAVAAGSTDENVADRFTIWLVKHNRYDEAIHVLRQALAAPPHSADTHERMRRRLARCESNRARA